ncbi:putative oxidoreductase YtbE [Anticarsia gemmatalis]|uniref:putative oxidoreductase YtbE n=1 Tax=Anticarsia gemmatalis TaxID=129554 RepID=UPI003F75C72C
MATAMDPESYTTTKFTLNNGTTIPGVGFGTYRIRCGDVIMKVVDEALAAGYRMFDTAAVYHNEGHLKKAFQTLLPKYGLEREEIFITTKLSPSDHGSLEVVRKAYKHSLDNLGLDYVDLYLIHFPGTAKLACDDKRNIDIRNMTWASLVDLYDNGLVNAIGVSNFTVKHLQQLLRSNHGVIPAVNQVEWHPFYHQQELLDYCKENDILLQAYCSLGGTSANNDSLLKHPLVTKIANKLEVTNAQVLLRWALQQDIAVIPKSTDPRHIKDNIALNFTIPNEDMRILSDLGSHKIKYAWDPSVVV